MEYEYDTTTGGIYFCYFLLSILALWLLPTTLSLILEHTSPSKHSSNTSSCHCQKCQDCALRRQETGKRTLKNPRISRRMAALIVGWAVFVPLLRVVIVTPAEVAKVLFDPYAILDVAIGATPVEIKKQYKQQSLKW